MGEPTVHESVEQAIETYGGTPGSVDVTGFHLWYEGCTVGAVPLAQMRRDAQGIAQRLIVLSAVIR